MPEFAEVLLPGGGSLVVETGEEEVGMVSAGRLRDVAQSATETFESAMVRLRAAADTVVDNMLQMRRAPNEVTVEFGIKLATQAGVVIANTGAEANLSITLTWTSREGNKPPAPA